MSQSKLANSVMKRWGALRNDRAYKAIFIALILSIVLTIGFGLLASRSAEASFWKSFYSSWVSNWLFFVVVSVVVAIGMHESAKGSVFAQRVKILLGGKEGPIADYVVKRLASFEQYADTAERVLLIKEYDPGNKAYFIKSTTKTNVRSFYGDMPSKVDTSFSFEADVSSESATRPNKVVSVIINGGKPIVFDEVISGTYYEKEIQISLRSGEVAELEVITEGWYCVSEEHSASMKRFTEKFVLSFQSHIKHAKVPVTIESDDADALVERHDLGFHEQAVHICTRENIEPGIPAYRFRLEEPKPVAPGPKNVLGTRAV